MYNLPASVSLVQGISSYSDFTEKWVLDASLIAPGASDKLTIFRSLSLNSVGLFGKIIELQAVRTFENAPMAVLHGPAFCPGKKVESIVGSS